MGKILLIVFIFLFIKVEAQNIVISFSSSNPNDKIDSVQVENLFQNKSRVIKGTDNLELTASTVGVATYGFDSQFKIYPNPATDNCYIQFENKVSGNVELSLYDFTGRQLVQNTISLEQGIHTFQVSELPAGISLLKVSGTNLNLIGKIINLGKGPNDLNFIRIMINSNAKIPVALKSASSNILMQYNAGETLKYTIYSNAGITVQTDVPTQSKTIETNFSEAKDMDGNRYATVKIGNQNWFAENLKTTKYNDGAEIPLVTDGVKWNNLTTPGYCWYNNDIANGNKYGALYNWHTVNTGKLCPSGWRVPSASDWIKMTSYLLANGYNYINNYWTYNMIAKSLSSPNSWETTAHEGSPGSSDNMQKQNITGFSALPGGHRFEYGSESDNFYNLGKIGVWWSNNSEIGVRLVFNENKFIGGHDDNQSGFSIRCIKGENYSDFTNDSIKDIDNNIYKTVVIGSQTWFAENLKTTKLNDGTKINLLTENWQWNDRRFSNPGYCWYDNDSIANSNMYGALYNKYAVQSGKLCPKGWHIPKDKDWDVLEIHLADNKYYYYTNDKSRAIAKALSSPSSWLYSNIEGAPGNTDYPEIQNSTGFSALAGGRRLLNEFENIGKGGYWWYIEYSIPGSCITIYYSQKDVDGALWNSGEGLSVRCIKD